MPNNRQWALLIWLAVVLIGVLSRAGGRQRLTSIAGAIGLRLGLALALLAGWVAGLVWLASQLGLWDTDRLADTVQWFLTGGLVLFGRLGDVSKEPAFLRRRALAAVELSVFVEVLSELFVWALWIELLVQPIVAFAAAGSVLAAHRAEDRWTKKVFDAIVIAASVAVLGSVLMALIGGWTSMDKMDLLQQFALPLWLTIGVLPLVYALGLASSYKQAFSRINGRSVGPTARRRAKLAMVVSFHFRARELGTFTGPWQFKIADAPTRAAARAVVAEFRQFKRAAAREEVEREERLISYAGVDGVDADGRRLDRREFDDTKAALQWLSTCQMGRYQRQGGRYQPGIAELVLDRYTATGRLPTPLDVQMRVSEDGQRWYGWRRTISGWVFAIGAGGPAPDEWSYDGPTVPSGFPGEDRIWGAGPFETDASRNW